MSIDTLLSLFYIWVVLFGALMVWLVVMVIMHFFMPKAMLSTYFKEPYFRKAEIAIFTAFPFNFFKDIMFMRLAAWPSSGRKRELTEAYKLAPTWFRRVSKILIWILLIIFPLMIAIMLFSLIAFWILDHS